MAVGKHLDYNESGLRILFAKREDFIRAGKLEVSQPDILTIKRRSAPGSQLMSNRTAVVRRGSSSIKLIRKLRTNVAGISRFPKKITLASITFAMASEKGKKHRTTQRTGESEKV